MERGSTNVFGNRGNASDQLGNKPKPIKWRLILLGTIALLVFIVMAISIIGGNGETLKPNIATQQPIQEQVNVQPENIQDNIDINGATGLINSINVYQYLIKIIMFFAIMFVLLALINSVFKDLIKIRRRV